MTDDQHRDNVLLQLRRKYSGNEIVNSLFKKIDDLEFKNGQLSSEVAHLEHELLERPEKNPDQENIKTLEKRIHSRNTTIKRLTAEVKRTKQSVTDLLLQLNKLKNDRQ